MPLHIFNIFKMNENPQPTESGTLGRESWDLQMSQGDAIINAIMDEFETFYKDEDWARAWLNTTANYWQYLRSRGLNPKEYAMYRTFIGSTSCYEENPKCDIPGDLSIMAYFQRYLEGLKQRTRLEDIAS